MKRRLLVIMLVLLLATVACFLASCGDDEGEKASEENGDSEKESQGLEYTLSDDGTYYAVTGIGTCTDTRVVIPKEYEGKPVKEIGERAFYFCESIEKITIPDCVQTLGEGAFYGCASITEMVIPDGVTVIGKELFYCCESLSSLIIPDGVVGIGRRAFAGCDSMTSLYVPKSVETIETEAFRNDLSLTMYCETESVPSGWIDLQDSYPAIVLDYKNNEIAEDGYIYVVQNNLRYALRDGEAILKSVIKNDAEDISIPKTVVYKSKTYNVTVIRGGFRNCPNLKTVTVPDGVTSIGSYAFGYCYNLTSISIPNSVTEIGYCAFYCCRSLVSVEIPDSVIAIGYGTFSGCDSLTNVNFANSNGWYAIVPYNETTEIPINAEDLENSSMAKDYLTGEYSQYDLFKK